MNKREIGLEKLKALITDDAPSVRIWDIARTFLGIGLASFSLAALGEVKNWVTEKRRWFTDDEYMHGLGLAQLMPGAPTVNLSSYLGFCLRGLPGATVATVFFLIPSFLLMLLLSYLYLKYGEMPFAAALFRGLGALVIGLVLNTILNLWRSGIKTIFEWLMALIGFTMVFWLKMGIIKILLIAGSASLIMVLLTLRFPTLARWTGSLSSLKKNNALSTVPGEEKPCPAATPTKESTNVTGNNHFSGKMINLLNTRKHQIGNASGPDYVLACSRVPLAMHWRQITLVVLWLAIILVVDLALIHLRPELMQMGGSFLRIGALVFGSGYAMLPFIQDTVVTQFGWLNNLQFAAALSLSLITPGPVTIIGVFIGYKVAGIAGAAIGMVNMYFPAWAMTTLVAAPYAKASQALHVKQVVGGIVAAFIGTLVVVLIKLSGDTLVDAPTIAMAAGAFLVNRFTKINTVWIVLAGAELSLFLYALSGFYGA